MPGGTGSPVTSTTLLSTIDRENLRLKLAGSSYLDGLFTGVALDGTAVQLSTLLVDASSDGLVDAAYDTDRFGNARIYIPAQGANSAEEHQVFGYDPGLGTIQPGKAFTATPTTAVTKYELHSHGLTVTQLHSALNWACRNAYYYDTIVLPGLLEDIDAVSPWTANSVGTTCPIAVDTDGKKSMRTLNTVDEAYTVQDPVNVMPNKSYSFYITLLRTVAGAFDIQFWDFAAGTQITTINPTIVPTITEGAGKRYLGCSVQIPDGCYSVQIRLVGTTSTAEAYWRDWGFRRLGDNMTLPTWMTDPKKMILNPGVLQLVADNGSYTGGFTKVAAPPEPQGMELPDGGYYGRVFLTVQRPHGPLSADTDTVPDNAQDWILTGALAQCYKNMARPRAADASMFARLYQEEHRSWINKCSVNQPERKHKHPVWSKW